MAQQQGSKEQNQAFLQEMERQRLQKSCNRIIDLRGKVTGECQAYQFGDRTHYLDDRGYLIARQLLARFKGRYTVGVYEALHKALKQLDENEKPDTATTQYPEIPFLKVDQLIHRSKQRVIFSTPIQIRLDDVLYHGHSIDVSAQAMRVNLKRTHSLNQGDKVHVGFSDLFEQHGLPFLQNIAFEIIKISHDESKTTLVLSLIATDSEVQEWLTNWVDSRAVQKPVDIDNEIQNQLSDSFLQLWLKRASSPIFWLCGNEPSSSLKHCLLSTPAAHLLSSLPQNKIHSAITKLPFNLGDEACEMIIVMTEEKSWVAPLHQSSVVSRLISWHAQQHNSQILLFKPHGIQLELSQYKEQIRQIASVDDKAASSLKKRLDNINYVATIYNVSKLCQHLNPVPNITAQQISTFESLPSVFSDALPQPKQISTQIQRTTQRYYIHTPVTLHVDEQVEALETLDVSADGLALSVPINLNIRLNQRVTVDFTRWQELTKKVVLEKIPYQVKNRLYWNERQHLGLHRIKANCPENLNVFFDEVIAKNQQNLNRNHQDIIDANESSLFLDLLKPTLENIPVYIGLDQQGQRKIQAIADSDANQASQLPKSFWLAFESTLTILSEHLKSLNAHAEFFSNTVLYAHERRQDQWQFTFEEEFEHGSHKTMYLQRAMLSPSFKCFHCELLPIPPVNTSSDNVLAEAFLKWRPQRANRIKHIRQQLNNLMGIVELTDVTSLLSSIYPR